MIFPLPSGCNDRDAPNDPCPLVYGLSYFRNLPDPSKPRGAVQMSMLLLLRKPFFLLFKPIVQEALRRFMEEHEVSVGWSY